MRIELNKFQALSLQSLQLWSEALHNTTLNSSLTTPVLHGMSVSIFLHLLSISSTALISRRNPSPTQTPFTYITSMPLKEITVL